MKNNELIADILEAVELMNKWRPFYLAVLKQTGSKEQATKSLKWVIKMEQELEIKKAS